MIGEIAQALAIMSQAGSAPVEIEFSRDGYLELVAELTRAGAPHPNDMWPPGRATLFGVPLRVVNEPVEEQAHPTFRIWGEHYPMLTP